jgi:hypothetical protein
VSSVTKSKTKTIEHVFIPDTQVKPGVNTDHIEAAGNYIADRKPDVIVVIGDWWDMPSLSQYEKSGSKYFHDKSYKKDIDAGNSAMERFLRPIRKHRTYNPRMVFTMGNHEYRIERAANQNPILEGIVDYKDLDLFSFEVYPFKKVVRVDGILYSHLFVNQQSLIKNELTGTMDNRINKVKQSFSQGHQQHRMWGSQFTSAGKEICGLVAGSFYSHDEDYAGPQGNHIWRGIVYKHRVKDGHYDPLFISLDYLVKEWL